MARASSVQPSDALVFFGATGDLAYKQIFPALLGLVAEEGLDIPIVGVAKAGWGLDQLKDRAGKSLAEHGVGDAAAEEKLLSLLRYVDGDYEDPATFSRLQKGSGRPRARCTIWRFRPSCSARWRRPWPRPAARTTRVSSSRSRSATTAPRPRSSTRC